MKQKFKFLIWDVDGTLYKSIPKMEEEIDVIYDGVFDALFPDLTKEERQKILQDKKKILHSTTRTIAALGGPSIEAQGELYDHQFDRTRYLKEDKKLIEMFRTILNNHPELTHLVVRNGLTDHTKKIITTLGLHLVVKEECEIGPFTKVYGVFDSFHTAKPDPKVAEYFRKNLEVDPREILWVGDRIEVDLRQAKKLGMSTVLVWKKEIKKEDKEIVDFVLPTVYNIPDILE